MGLTYWAELGKILKQDHCLSSDIISKVFSCFDLDGFLGLTALWSIVFYYIFIKEISQLGRFFKLLFKFFNFAFFFLVLSFQSYFRHWHWMKT